jgi:hypothetical protein
VSTPEVPDPDVAAIDAPEADVLEQQQPVDADAVDDPISEAARAMPIDANEADVLEQSEPVVDGDDDWR